LFFFLFDLLLFSLGKALQEFNEIAATLKEKLTMRQMVRIHAWLDEAPNNAIIFLQSRRELKMSYIDTNTVILILLIKMMMKR